MKSLNEFAKDCYEVACKREKKQQISTDTLQMLKHCAGEVVEATEAYSKYNDDVMSFENELADIVCCVLIIAENENLNIEKALERVYEKNKKRAEG